jgi:glycosyltransferase involved in cell wall biosynthesis
MKKNKKILHFHPDEKYATIFVGPLMEAEKNSYDTKIIISNGSNSNSDWTVPYDLRIGIFFYIFRSFIKIVHILIKFKPDIVISHNSRSSSIPLFASWLTSIPIRIYFNHGVPYIGYTSCLRFLLKIQERFNCFFSTDVVTVSGDMVDLLQDVAPKSKVDIINFGSACGIDLKVFHPKQNSHSPFRDLNQINDNVLMVAYIGRPNKRKGFEKCLNLWVENFQSSEYRLILCGISESDVLRFLSFIPKNVMCLGFTDQIPQILREADCLLLPSFHEGFSYATLEALASGCIVLANNVHGVRNIITNHVNGILIDDNDQNSYVKYIKLIKSEPDKFLDMKSEGLIQAGKFCRDIFLESYLSKLTAISNKDITSIN